MTDELAYCGGQNVGSGGILVIDTVLGTQIANWQPGNIYNGGMAIMPDGSAIFAVRSAAQLVEKIDTTTGLVLHSYGISGVGATNPNGVCVTPDGSTLYVVCPGGGTNTLVSVNLTTNVITNPAATSSGLITGSQRFPSVSPDGTKLAIPYTGSNASGGRCDVYSVPGLILLATIIVPPANTGSNTSLIWKGNTVGYNWYSGHFVGFALDMVGYVEIGTPWAVTPQSGGIAQTALSLTPDGLHVYLAGGSTGPPDNFSKWSTASNTEVAHFPLGVNIDGCAVTPDGSTVVVTDVGSSHVYLWDTATDTLRATVATTDRSLNLVLFPAAPVTTLTVGDLFIPRKGLSDPYTSFDFNADWLAIETWANHSWSTSPPNLFIPCKPSSRPPTVLELNANWHAIEDWADAIGTLNTVAIPPLFIPRKNSLDPTDLGSCFLAIQDWANAL